MVSNKPVTDRETDFLLLVQKHINENGKAPSNTWLSDELHISKSGVSNLKRKLKEKGFLDNMLKESKLTQKAQNLIESLVGRIAIATPITIPLVGNVKAGRTKHDEIVVTLPSIEDLNLSDITQYRTISIPTQNERVIFALEVIGRSMEHENIFDGDIVLVQPININETITDGELIIAMYLPPYNENEFEEGSSGNIPIEYFEGPTIKYFYTNPKTKQARLSWRKSHDLSEYTTITKEVRPIGKVIGIYREIAKK